MNNVHKSSSKFCNFITPFSSKYEIVYLKLYTKLCLLNTVIEVL